MLISPYPNMLFRWAWKKQKLSCQMKISMKKSQRNHSRMTTAQFSTELLAIIHCNFASVYSLPWECETLERARARATRVLFSFLKGKRNLFAHRNWVGVCIRSTRKFFTNHYHQYGLLCITIFREVKWEALLMLPRNNDSIHSLKFVALLCVNIVICSLACVCVIFSDLSLPISLYANFTRRT